MGSIIRCAAAVGCKLLITTPGNKCCVLNYTFSHDKYIGHFELIIFILDCVDVWDSKVLRAASGAHFRIKLALGVDWDLISENFVTQDDTVLLADSSIQVASTVSPTADEKDRSASNRTWIEREQSQNCRSVEILEDGNIRQRDSSYLDHKTLRVYKKLLLPQFAYDKLNLDFVTSVTLVIGGETHGLSSAAHKLAHEYGGLKVYDPLPKYNVGNMS